MTRRGITRKLVGETIKVTWVNSSVTPANITLGIYTGSETLISSASMISSGGGHFYGLYTLPTTPGYYVAETIALVAGYPYPNRLKLKAVKGEVD